MSQHDKTISDQEGSPFLAEVNQALAAIWSNDSGGTAPATTVAYQWWADTASGMLKQRNAANNGWVDVALLSSFALPSVQKQLATAFTTTGTSSAYLLTPAPAIAANTAGYRFRVAFHTTPSGTPTLAVSGQTALPLKYKDYAGVKQTVTSLQVPANWVSDVETDGVDWLVLDVPPYSLLLAHLLALDGAGSGLDADLLDGQEGSYYLNSAVSRDHNYNNVGSFCLCYCTYSADVFYVYAGSTVAGAYLQAGGVRRGSAADSAEVYGGAGLSGTWRALGNLLNTPVSSGNYRSLTLCQRIA